MARINPRHRVVHETFGSLLQKLRAQRELTFREVSEISELGVQTIFSLEVGALAPRLDHIVDLHKVYGDDLIKVVNDVIISKGQP